MMWDFFGSAGPDRAVVFRRAELRPTLPLADYPGDPDIPARGDNTVSEEQNSIITVSDILTLSN